MRTMTDGLTRDELTCFTRRHSTRRFERAGVVRKTKARYHRRTRRETNARLRASLVD